MQKPIVVFGTGAPAQLAVEYFRTDSSREVAGLTVDNEFRIANKMWGLPLVPYEDIVGEYPPSEFDLFVAIGYSGRNRIRREKFLDAANRGYAFATYVSSRATILTETIGQNCFILEDNTVQPFSSIGDNTTLWSGNHIGHHSSIGDHVFVTSHVVVSGNCHIGDSCFLGVNATVRDGISIGPEAIVGAGSLVMRDVSPKQVLVPRETRAKE